MFRNVRDNKSKNQNSKTIFEVRTWVVKIYFALAFQERYAIPLAISLLQGDTKKQNPQ